jgi:hypothetical protein
LSWFDMSEYHRSDNIAGYNNDIPILNPDSISNPRILAPSILPGIDISRPPFSSRNHIFPHQRSDDITDL